MTRTFPSFAPIASISDAHTDGCGLPCCLAHIYRHILGSGAIASVDYMYIYMYMYGKGFQQ